MNLHKQLRHNNLRRLPNEILVKIIGYVVPDCKDCFQQREILKLSSVSKWFNELVKAADFYREIKIGYCDHHPTPPISIIYKILRYGGSQLKNIKCKLPQNCDITFWRFTQNTWARSFPEYTRWLSKCLTSAEELNHVALIHLEMQTYVGDAKLAATVRRGKQPLSKRFQSLQIDACYRYKREVAPVAFSALMGIPSLTKVTVRCHFTSIDLNYVNLDSDLKSFKTWLSETVLRMKVINSKFVTSEGRGDSY